MGRQGIDRPADRSWLTDVRGTEQVATQTCRQTGGSRSGNPANTRDCTNVGSMLNQHWFNGWCLPRLDIKTQQLLIWKANIYCVLSFCKTRADFCTRVNKGHWRNVSANWGHVCKYGPTLIILSIRRMASYFLQAHVCCAFYMWRLCNLMHPTSLRPNKKIWGRAEKYRIGCSCPVRWLCCGYVERTS